MRICHVGALHHASLFEKSAFSTNYRSVSDYHFLLQQLDSIHDVYVDQELVEIQSGGVSTQALAPYLEELKMKMTLPDYNRFGLSVTLIEKLFRSQISKLVRKIVYL